MVLCSCCRYRRPREGSHRPRLARVLNEYPRVAAQTRRRVRQAMDALGYEPNNLARNLRARSLRIFGLIVPDILASFFTARTALSTRTMLARLRRPARHAPPTTPRPPDNWSPSPHRVSVVTQNGPNYGGVLAWCVVAFQSTPVRGDRL